MAINRLFNGDSWKLTMPDVFKNMKPSSTEYTSVYCTMQNKQSKLHAPTLYAITAYSYLEHNQEALGAIGLQNDCCVAEYANYSFDLQKSETSEARSTVFYNPKNGKFWAGNFNEPNTQPYAYSMNERECHGAALFFALMPIALRNDEFKKYYNQFSICMVNGFQQTTELEEAAYILCDNFYRRINMAEQMDEIGIFVSLPSKGSLPLFTELNLNNGFYSPTKVLSGKFIMLIPKKATSITINPEKLAGKYHDGTVYTKKEIDMIPKLKDSYIVPQEVISICEHISKTAGSSHPIRNIMLRGESSVGKTSSAKAVASALGRPMVAPVTCHADFETADFLMQCVPVETQVDETFDLPTFEDILMDPSTAYHMLTGEYIENITETEVYEKLTERIYQKAQLQNSNTKSPVRYQESSLITAMRYGYVCEVQEPSVILKQGVLVGLNSLLDDCEEIMLPTGERLHRHPNTIIILTTNNDYEGCQNFNQSVISRMDLIYDIDDLKMDDYIERGMANTGFQDRNMVAQMAETLLEVKNHLKERYITDGSCGLREFIAWIQSYMITGKIIDSAIITILSSLSKEMENRNEIYDTCIKTKFLK